MSLPSLSPHGQASFDTSRRLGWLCAGLCALAVPIAVYASRPVVEMGYCDDFAYILSAIGLEKTGHTVYNGWAAAALGWMMFYGALVVRLFGFSFASIHASILPFGMACAVLLQRINARLGLRNVEATFGALTIVLSLLFLPLSFSFMTDVPGLFVFTLCFYLCQRALAAATPREACAWIVVAALSNAAGGTVRQFDWVGLFAMVPAVLWCYRRERVVRVYGGVAWLVSMAYCFYFMHWFGRQPYSIRDNYLVATPGPAQAVHNLLQGALVMGLFLLPVTVAFLLPRRTRTWLSLGALLVGCGVAFTLYRLAPDVWIAPFQSDSVNIAGLVIPSVIGWRPPVLTPPIRVTLTVLIIATLVAVLASLVPWLSRQTARRIAGSPSHTLLAATFVISAVLTFIRATVWSRYYLSILVLIVPVLLHLYRAGARTVAAADAQTAGVALRLPMLGAAVLALFTAFTIVAMHDQYATERARLAAADELIARGYSRDRFWAGFEYDGWTQIVKTGTLNDVRLGPPTAFYRVPPKQHGGSECTSWFASWTPDIHPEVQLAFDDLSWCAPQITGMKPLHYRAWFPPRDREIYFLAVP